MCDTLNSLQIDFDAGLIKKMSKQEEVTLKELLRKYQDALAYE